MQTALLIAALVFGAQALVGEGTNEVKEPTYQGKSMGYWITRVSLAPSPSGADPGIGAFKMFGSDQKVQFLLGYAFTNDFGIIDQVITRTLMERASGDMWLMGAGRYEEIKETSQNPKGLEIERIRQMVKRQAQGIHMAALCGKEIQPKINAINMPLFFENEEVLAQLAWLVQDPDSDVRIAARYRWAKIVDFFGARVGEAVAPFGIKIGKDHMPILKKAEPEGPAREVR